MAAEVLHQRRELVVGHVGERRPSPPASAPARNRSRSSAPRTAKRRLVLLVRHVVDVAAQVLAARPGEGRLQPAAVLGLDDVPAGVVEELHRARWTFMPGDDPVEALAVEVDDPGDVAEALQRGVGDGLPDVALVELGVADEGDEAGRGLRRRSGRRRSAGRPPRTAARPRRGRPSRSRSRRRRGPWCGSGRPAGRRAPAAGSGSERSSSPVRYLMAWKTGEACGLTATLSSPLRWPNHSAVMIPTIDAELAWWPPTLIVARPAGRGWRASTIRTASHRTRCCTASRRARGRPAGWSPGCPPCPEARADVAAGNRRPYSAPPWTSRVQQRS